MFLIKRGYFEKGMSILVGVSFLEMLSKYWMEIMFGNVPLTYTKKLDQVFKIFLCANPKCRSFSSFSWFQLCGQ